MNYNSSKYKEFYEIISDMAENPTIQEMKKYRQHYNSSCFDHCFSAAYYCFCICKKLKLDYRSATRAAMVHDLFLYDWRVKDTNRKGIHAFKHPIIAYEKASKLFKINKKEKDIILKHMWPVTIIPPKYLESYILTLVDKYSALEEGYNYYKEKVISKKFLRYASMFLLIFFIHIP